MPTLLVVKSHTQSFLNGFADFKKLVIFVFICAMSYLYQEIIYSFLSEIAAAFVLHQLEVWDYNYKQAYLCILPPPTFSPSLLPSTAGLLLSQGGRSYGRWSRGTAAHLARPSSGKGTGGEHLAVWQRTLCYYDPVQKYIHAACYWILAWTCQDPDGKISYFGPSIVQIQTAMRIFPDRRKTSVGKNTLYSFNFNKLTEMCHVFHSQENDSDRLLYKLSFINFE